MTDQPTITQQLAVEIHLIVGAQIQTIHIPVVDSADSLALQKRIVKTVGKIILGEDTEAPMTIDCRHVPFMRTVLLAPQVQQSPPSSRIAKLHQ